MEQSPGSGDGRPADDPGTGVTPPPRQSATATYLVALGIPGLVAVVAVGAVLLWMRAEPSTDELSPRLPATPGATVAEQDVSSPFPEGEAITPESGAAPADEDGLEPWPAEPGPEATPGVQAAVPQGTSPAASSPTPQRPSTPAASRPAATRAAATPSLPGAWPAFRGPRRDNISREQGLATSWPAGGPPRLWSVSLGEGHAAPAVQDGRVFLLDYDHPNQADRLRCFSLADGRELWSHSYPVVVRRNHGMSRTVPAVSGRHVVTLGPMCHVLCADTETGAVRWQMDLVRDWGATVPPWYAGQCPLIDGDRVILAPGGKALMMAVELGSGRVIWQTPNPRGWRMTHASIMPAEIGGTRMYVYPASGGVVGVSAADGKVLWETTEWTVSTANIPTPIPVGDGRILLTGGYNSGAMMLRIRESGGRFTPEVLYRLKPAELGSDQQTPVLYQNHIYAVIPGGQLACLDLNGRQLWTSPTSVRFGLGPYMIAGGMIYVLSDRGELALVRATPQSYQEVSRAKVLQGPDAWGPLALAGGRLLARDDKTMVCLNVGAR